MVKKVIVLGHKACSQETFKMWFGKVVSHPTPTCVHKSQDKASTTRSKLFMMNICTYNLTFKIFGIMKRKGDEDLVCGKMVETNWILRFLK